LTGYQRELFIAMLLENEAKEDKQKIGWKTSRNIQLYTI